jgi:hypothetical protein
MITKTIYQSLGFQDLKSVKYSKMHDIKSKHKLKCIFEDARIRNFNADSKLGGAKLIMSFQGHLKVDGPFYNDSRISNIEFTLDLKTGFLSWLDLWKVIDDFIVENKIDRSWIGGLNAYKYKGGFYNTPFVKVYFEG